MANETMNELLSVDLKGITNEGKEATVRFKNFKNCKDAHVSYNYDEVYNGYSHLPSTLKSITITIPCNGYELEVFNK